MLCIVAVSGCFSPVGEGDDGGGAGGGGGGAAGGTGGSGGAGGSGGGGACSADSQCAVGQVCEGCTANDAVCVPGCRSSAQCRAGEVCQSGVVCITCPCAPGQCVPNLCSDPDGDGFIASCDKSLNCPGLGRCDCNPFNAGVYPGAAERCSNGVDDDCDGLVDAADPACATCGPGSTACTSSFDCSLGATTCGAGGCCEPCPVQSPLVCPAGQCLHSGVLRSGCFDVECAPCGGVCPAVYQPVCARLSYVTKTFGNACEANSAGATIIHSGECLAGEGVGCGFTPMGGLGKCGNSGTLYCRDTCPMCDDGMLTCTRLGACVADFDCPAGLPPPSCGPGKKPSYACVSNACVASCS